MPTRERSAPDKCQVVPSLSPALLPPAALATQGPLPSPPGRASPFVRSLGFLAFRGLFTQHILACKEPLQLL